MCGRPKFRQIRPRRGNPWWVMSCDTAQADVLKQSKIQKNKTIQENKLAKARKMRKPSGTLSLKKFGLGNLWVEKFLGQKSFWV